MEEHLKKDKRPSTPHHSTSSYNAILCHQLPQRLPPFHHQRLGASTARLRPNSLALGAPGGAALLDPGDAVAVAILEEPEHVLSIHLSSHWQWSQYEDGQARHAIIHISYMATIHGLYFVCSSVD